MNAARVTSLVALAAACALLMGCKSDRPAPQPYRSNTGSVLFGPDARVQRGPQGVATRLIEVDDAALLARVLGPHDVADEAIIPERMRRAWREAGLLAVVLSPDEAAELVGEGRSTESFSPVRTQWNTVYAGPAIRNGAIDYGFDVLEPGAGKPGLMSRFWVDPVYDEASGAFVPRMRLELVPRHTVRGTVPLADRLDRRLAGELPGLDEGGYVFGELALRAMLDDGAVLAITATDPATDWPALAAALDEGEDASPVVPTAADAVPGPAGPAEPALPTLGAVTLGLGNNADPLARRAVLLFTASVPTRYALLGDADASEGDTK